MINNDLKHYDLILQHIKNVAASTNVPLVDTIMKELGIGRSSAYKRIEGSYRFSLEEIIHLAIFYRISLDQFLSNRFLPYPFQADALIKQPQRFEDYLHNISKYMNGIKVDKEVKVYYLANEIPLFHLIPFLPVLYFKLFMWNKTNWRSIPCSDRFALADFETTNPVIDAAKELANIYYGFNDVQIWNTRMFDTTFDQIRYMTNAFLFENKNDALILLEEMSKLLRYLTEITESGSKKYHDGQGMKISSSQIFINEVVSNPEIIFTKNKRGNLLFINYDTPNFISTSDARFGAHTEQWLEGILKLSTPISRENTKERNHVIHTMKKKFDQSKQEVLGLLEYLY